MFVLILTAISLLVVLSALITGVIIVYHFKRFGIKDDPKIERFLKIFKIGGGIIILFNFILLLLVII